MHDASHTIAEMPLKLRFEKSTENWLALCMAPCYENGSMWTQIGTDTLTDWQHKCNRCFTGAALTTWCNYPVTGWRTVRKPDRAGPGRAEPGRIRPIRCCNSARYLGAMFDRQFSSTFSELQTTWEAEHWEQPIHSTVQYRTGQDTVLSVYWVLRLHLST